MIHRYVVEEGLIKDAEFIIPTTHNMLAIERALKVAGNRYVSPEGINLELEKAGSVGWCVHLTPASPVRRREYADLWLKSKAH